MQKNDSYYIEKTLEEIEIVLEYSNEKSLYDLQMSNQLVDSIVFRLIQMAEFSDKISDQFKILHPEINWSDMKGFRNRLVHDYGSVDLNFVYTAITHDIIELKTFLLKYS